MTGMDATHIAGFPAELPWYPFYVSDDTWLLLRFGSTDSSILLKAQVKIHAIP
jgi:hypothetical protein